jgi:EamA domain-containing membrane protein RarD
MFVAAIFLVVVPVFFQAPLVRSLPWLSLTLTGTWLLGGISLASRANTAIGAIS